MVAAANPLELALGDTARAAMLVALWLASRWRPLLP
jgi:hypothetical protein